MDTFLKEKHSDTNRNIVFFFLPNYEGSPKTIEDTEAELRDFCRDNKIKPKLDVIDVYFEEEGVYTCVLRIELIDEKADPVRKFLTDYKL